MNKLSIKRGLKFFHILVLHIPTVESYRKTLSDRSICWNMVNWAGNPGCLNNNCFGKLDLALDPRKVPRKHAWCAQLFCMICSAQGVPFFWKILSVQTSCKMRLFFVTEKYIHFWSPITNNDFYSFLTKNSKFTVRPDRVESTQIDLWIVTRLKEQWCAQYSSGMQHRMVAFLVSILYYSSPDAFWCALLRLAVNNSRAI